VRNADGSVDVYASWNGATAISHWQVRGGRSAGTLVSLKTVPRSGFETRVRIQHRPRLVAAVALDRRGKVLASSPLITT
jgi:ligand-binding sensor domain-containing protein